MKLSKLKGLTWEFCQAKRTKMIFGLI